MKAARRIPPLLFFVASMAGDQETDSYVIHA